MDWFWLELYSLSSPAEPCYLTAACILHILQNFTSPKAVITMLHSLPWALARSAHLLQQYLVCTSLTGDLVILLQAKAGICGIKPAWLYQWGLMTCKIQFAVNINSLLFPSWWFRTHFPFCVAVVQVKRYVGAYFHIPSQQHQIQEKIIAYCQEKGLSFFKSLVLQLNGRCITRAALSAASWCSAQMLSACRKSQCNERPEQQAPSVTC